METKIIKVFIKHSFLFYYEEIQAIERFRKKVDKLLMHNQCIINAYALLKARFFVKI